MKKNKFVEGEVVILQSQDFPELSGEYTVRHVVFWNDKVYDRIAQKVMYRRPRSGAEGDPPAYIFEEVIPRQDGARVEIAWKEIALRKKHLPSTESYETLMSSLKLGQPVRV